MTVRFGRLAAVIAVSTLRSLSPARPRSPRRPATRRRTTRRRSGSAPTIFADYTVTEKPKIKDADGNEVTPNAFNVGRAYINVTGNISHIIAFRDHAGHHPRDRHRQLAERQLHLPPEVRLRAVQPGRLDDARVVGRGSACSRRRGSTSRRAIYRYRFQGTVFAEREGYLSSSDVGRVVPLQLAAATTATSTAASTTARPTTSAEANDQKALHGPRHVPAAAA